MSGSHLGRLKMCKTGSLLCRTWKCSLLPVWWETNGHSLCYTVAGRGHKPTNLWNTVEIKFICVIMFVPSKYMNCHWEAFLSLLSGIDIYLGYYLQHSPFSTVTNLVHRTVNTPEGYSGKNFVRPKTCEIFLWFVDHCCLFPCRDYLPALVSSKCKNVVTLTGHEFRCLWLLLVYWVCECGKYVVPIEDNNWISLYW